MADGERRTTEAFREQVVASATTLFADRGYAGTSVQDVADAVGASKQLVLYHFGSKEGLREAVMEGIRAAWLAWLPALLEAAGPAAGDGTASEGAGALEAAGRALAGFLATHPHAARLVMREIITEGGEARAALYDLVRPSMEAGAAEFARIGGMVGPDAALRGMARVQLLGILLLAVHAVFDPGDPVDADGAQVRDLVYAELGVLLRKALRA